MERIRKESNAVSTPLIINQDSIIFTIYNLSRDKTETEIYCKQTGVKLRAKNNDGMLRAQKNLGGLAPSWDD